MCCVWCHILCGSHVTCTDRAGMAAPELHDSYEIDGAEGAEGPATLAVDGSVPPLTGNCQDSDIANLPFYHRPTPQFPHCS